jgi:hypothetical protein
MAKEQVKKDNGPDAAASACCDSVLLSTCCGQGVKPQCCGPEKAPVVCGCGGSKP